MSKRDKLLDKQWFKLKVNEAAHHIHLMDIKKEETRKKEKALSAKEMMLAMLSFSTIISSVMCFIIYFPRMIQ